MDENLLTCWCGSKHWKVHNGYLECVKCTEEVKFSATRFDVENISLSLKLNNGTRRVNLAKGTKIDVKA
jgi:hypothetical protein